MKSVDAYAPCTEIKKDKKKKGTLTTATNTYK